MILTEIEQKQISLAVSRVIGGKLVKRFNDEYQFLYDNYDRVAGYQEAVVCGDYMLRCKELKKAVHRLSQLRGDVITSDRECAALAFTFFALIDQTPDPITGEMLC